MKLVNQNHFIIVFLVLNISFFNVNAQSQSDTTKRLSGIGGPSSVSGQINRDTQHKSEFMQSYFDFKTQLKKNSGFTYGIDYFTIFQTATASLGDKSAFSGVFRTYGSWNLAGKKSGNTGTFIFKFENRHKYKKFIVGQDMASEIGYAGLTSITFSNMGWVLTNFYWQQQLLKTRLSFVLGILDATDYLNIYGLADPWNDVSNLTFSTGAHIPVPNQGLGIAVRGLITDHIYVLAGIEDANGDPTDPLGSFESFFGEAEYFTHAEVGWMWSYDSRFSDNIHLTYWHAAARTKANVPEGWGLALSMSRMLKNHWEPFLRAGYADEGGTLLEGSVDVGLGYHFDNNNQLTLGLSWGKPSKSTFGEELESQYTMELYYRLHLMKIFTLTPDIQLLFNPALNPDKNFIAVFGLRGRISF